ncbi:MAG: transcription initiation factor IIB [Thermoplasmatales archaeon]|nr:MAG: transcription initiation factor IIB [Thermoplasmatales archaeon]
MEKEKKEQNRLEETIKCQKCGNTHLTKDYSRAEIVCDKCGLVIDADLIDQGPEWRAFDSEQREKKARTGSPMTYTRHDKGLSTTISWQNRDAYGRSIPSRNRAQLYRLRKWQTRTRISNGVERNLSIALSSLDRMSSMLTLPRNIRETAAMIYRKAARQKLTRGRTTDGITAAVLYAACRQCNLPRTLEEISRVSQIKKKEIGRNYRNISRKLKLKLLPTIPQDYISRFCSQLNLNSYVQTKAIDILKKAFKKELTSGKGPTGMAAAALYIATVLCGERRTQRNIAEVAGVTEVTIRNRYKEIASKLDIEILI